MSAREIIADGVELWHGDAVDIVTQLGTIERLHCITDPPYEDTMHKAKAKGRRGLRTDGGPNPKALTFESIDQLRPVITKSLTEICTGWFIAFCSPEGIAAWRDAIEADGARYKRACFWGKLNPMPQMNGQGPAFGVEPFVTAWCGSGVSKWNGGGRTNLFMHATNQPDKWGDHETEKPLSLMMELISLFTNPGDTVLDPFMGVATTGVACVNLGRHFIGIERDAKFYGHARRRIIETIRQTNLFEDMPKIAISF
jgi:site-specific DNA-methyltransferase (adenine-specific)